MRVTSEDGLSSTTYTINASRGGIQPPAEIGISIEGTAGGFILRVQGTPIFSIDYTRDLSSPWSEIARDLTGPFTETDPGRLGNASGFYRARATSN